MNIKHKVICIIHKIGFYFYSIKYYLEDYKDKNFLNAIIDCFKIFKKDEYYYEYLEIPVTSSCNLKCKGCANLIPCYGKGRDYDLKILKNSINMFLKCINNIVIIRLLGGEPFLSDNLYYIINILLNSNKVQRVEIVSNGTIVPRDKKLISILKESRVIVSISKYPNIDIDSLINFLKDNSIKYKVVKRKYWYNYGTAVNQNKNEKELIKQFANCNNICRSMINGQIHFCPRSSHGTDLGIITNNRDDYIDILDKKLSINDKKVLISNFNNKKYIKACNYCNYGTKKCSKILVAEQIRNKKE